MAARQDFEALTVILSISAIIAIGALISTLPELRSGSVVASSVQGYSMPANLRQGGGIAAEPAPAEPPRPMTERELKITERFQQAVALLHAKQYDYAITALDTVLEMAPELPEAYVNMGYAFLGLEEYGPASKAFERAIDLKLDQANAYYGLGMAYEGLKEYEAALGAMRSFIHLSPPDDPFVAKARSALWEWEAQLGRIPGVQPAPPGAEPEGQALDWSAGHKPQAQQPQH